ncbi:DUF2491 family protein [Polycladidibacter stylochi]|uniref:DUF2491 family protein n=1 Tax=Polycladidibacter stylochi TaxID=1807766 RepID=UPI000833B078|nr:DUF2491 family protein [Pseudovibrio stylochi]
MFNFFRKSNKQSALPQLHGITIDRAVAIDSVAVKILPDDSLMDVPTTAFKIVAQGHCDLGEQSHLHRFYPDDDRLLLQLQGGDGFNDERVDEIMLWTYYDVQYPSSEEHWQEVRDSICLPSFTLDGPNGAVVYERAWFGNSSRHEEPMQYWEQVFEDASGKKSRRIFQTAMLFGRTLSDGQNEMLLVNMEEDEKSGERSVAYMLGRMLAEHELNI